MNRFSARIRCLRPRSIHSHSAAATIRGTRSKGKISLGAGAVAVHVERDPHVQEGALGRLLPAQQLAVRHRLDELTSALASGRGWPPASNISSKNPSVS